MVIYLRNVWVYLAGLVLTVFWATRVVLHSYGKPCKLKDFCVKAPKIWSRAILRLGGIRVDVEGAENIAPGQPQIVVANHASWFDVWAISGYFPGPYQYVAKQELSRIPIFGKAWIACGHIAIDRSDLSSAVASLDRAAEKIRKDDATIVMFPEGTRSRTGELQSFKKGAFMLALKAGVPVVPLGIVGSRSVMPKGSWLVRPGHIRLRIGRPIPVEPYSVRERDALVRKARGEVAALLEEGPTGAATGAATGSATGSAMGSATEAPPAGQEAGDRSATEPGGSPAPVDTEGETTSRERET